MSDWQIGDLALCVVGGPSIAAGEVHTVATVFDTGLSLTGKISTSWRGSYKKSRFIKVTPPAADEFDRETIALMNGVKEPVT